MGSIAALRAKNNKDMDITIIDKTRMNIAAMELVWITLIRSLY